MVEIRDLENDVRYGDSECPECGGKYMRYGIEDDSKNRYQPFVGCDDCEFEEQTEESIPPSMVSSKQEVWEKASEMCLKEIN